MRELEEFRMPKVASGEVSVKPVNWWKRLCIFLIACELVRIVVIVNIATMMIPI